ncbi:methyltransferase [bacterium DOLJORAL78_65_58]|nr:MAG: methyltransferase [bacterium DOLZORAL124_64_63]PIE76425.1 MAG: methyltransferase [bacterium DOLJORAL78_65_58]
MRKSLPPMDTSYEVFFKMPYEALKWELLKTALEWKLFDRTSAGTSAAALSDALGLHPGNTTYLLNALVALGLLTKKDGVYTNTARAERFLTTGKDTSLGEALLFMAGWTTPLLNGGVQKLVENGPPPQDDLTDPAIWVQGARVSLSHSRCARAQYVARLVAELPEFPSFTRILDLGSGPGIIGIAVTAAHPSLKCVVFDQPPVCTVAREAVVEYGMEERVAVQEGDYMSDDFGSGYDFVMANYTLNFYRDRLADIMTKVLQALRPGGVFMVTSDGLNRDRTAPAGSIISWLPIQLQGNDMSFESGQIARAMREAGFVSTEMRVLTDVEVEAHGSVEMTLGRKKG